LTSGASILLLCIARPELQERRPSWGVTLRLGPLDAGEVAELGAEVTGFIAGDPVMCLASGGYAEYAVAEPGQSMILPKGLSMEAAATLPAALLTTGAALMTYLIGKELLDRLHGQIQAVVPIQEELEPEVLVETARRIIDRIDDHGKRTIRRSACGR